MKNEKILKINIFVKKIWLRSADKGCSDLKKREDEANGKVWQPVEASSHSVSSRSVWLFKQLRSEQERHTSYKKKTKVIKDLKAQDLDG